MASKAHEGANVGKGVKKARDINIVFENVCFKHESDNTAPHRGGGAGLPEVTEVSENRAEQLSVLNKYRGADKSLARPTSPCILFDGENISFDASLVIYINSTNIPPIVIINRIYETKSSVAVACFLLSRAKDLSAPLCT